jgi:hypothetical protein
MSKLLNWYYVNTIRNDISQTTDAIYEITNQPNVYQTYSDTIILRGREVNRFVQILRSIVIGTRFYVNLSGNVTVNVSCSVPRTFSCWVITDNVSESFYSLSSSTPYETREFSLNVEPNQTYTILIVSESETTPEDVFVYATATTKLYPYPNPFVYVADSDTLYATLSNVLSVQLERYQPFIVGAGTTVTTSNLVPNRILISDENGKIANSSIFISQLNALSNVTTIIEDKQDLITGAASTIVTNNLPTGHILISDNNGKVAVGELTTTDLSYLDGLTGSVQQQLNAKQDAITGAASTITVNNLTANRVLIANASGKVAVGNVGTTELSYLTGVTSSIQGQINFLSSTKQNSITGAASTVTTNNLSTNRIVISNTQGKIAASTIPVNDLVSLLNNPVLVSGFSNLDPLRVLVSDTFGRITSSTISLSNLLLLEGLTSNIQFLLDGKEPTITGAITSVTQSNLDPDLVVVTDAEGKLTTAGIYLYTLLYLDGLNGNVQEQLDGKEPTITGAISTITQSNLDPNLVVVTDPDGKLATSSISMSNLLLLEGLTCNVQQQLDSKQANITGAITTVLQSNLNPNLVVVTDPDGKLGTSSISVTNLALLEGVTSNVQQQLDSKQPTITGAITTVTKLNLDPDVIVFTNSEGKIVNGNSTSIFTGINGNIQDQIDGKLSLTGGVVTGEVYIANTLTTCNLNVIGNTASVESINLYSSNLFVNNITGFGPALKITQKSLDGSGHIAEFYDFDISTINPIFVVADLGNVGIGTYDPRANFHVEGTIKFASLDPNRVIITDSNSYVNTSPVTVTELSYLLGARDNIQTQIDNIQGTFTGAVTTIISSNLTPDRVAVSDGNGKVATGSITTGELSYLSGARSNLQTQIDTIKDSFSGAVTTIISSNLTPDRILVSDANGKVGVGTATTTELGYLSGVTSSIQTQINSKQHAITGAATTITTSNLTANRVAVSDANGKVAVGNVTTTELNYLSGSTSNIQGQINYIQNATNLIYIQSGASNIAGNVTLSNVFITGALSTNGGVGILGPTVLLQASNITTLQNTPIYMLNLCTYNGNPCNFASLDPDGKAVTFNTEGVYRISCLKAFSGASKAQRTWTIQKWGGAITNPANLLDETTPAFTSVAGAEMGLRAGQKILIQNTGQTQNYTNANAATPSLWSIIPLTIGYIG